MNNANIIELDPAYPSQTAILQAAAVLKEGGLVVCPTETRYGFLARADLTSAVDKLYEAKGRSRTIPTAVFVGTVRDIDTLGKVTPLAKTLAERFLPGRLTLVLRSRVEMEAPLVVDGKIGIRVSSSPVIATLLEAVDFPLTATSANPSGQKECETIKDISHMFGPAVELYLDVGRLNGPVSTVVDASGLEPVILREGAILKPEIDAVCDRKVI